MAKKYPEVCEWIEPKSQAQKLVDGEGASLSGGVAASVPMYGDDAWNDAWNDGRYKGYGPNPFPKKEKPV